MGRDGAIPLRARPTFVAIGYATAFAYTLLTLRGIVHGADADLVNGLMIGIPTAAAVGSYFLWDGLEWKASRSGFMALGSLGGALAGFFVSGIIDYAAGGIDSRLTSGIVLAGAVAGQATALALTARIPDERWKIPGGGDAARTRLQSRSGPSAVPPVRPGPRRALPGPRGCGTAPPPGARARA